MLPKWNISGGFRNHFISFSANRLLLSSHFKQTKFALQSIVAQTKLTILSDKIVRGLSSGEAFVDSLQKCLSVKAVNTLQKNC